MQSKDSEDIHKTTIGGQALIEGIMMRGPSDVAIAVRKPNKEQESNAVTNLIKDPVIP